MKGQELGLASIGDLVEVSHADRREGAGRRRTDVRKVIVGHRISIAPAPPCGTPTRRYDAGTARDWMPIGGTRTIDGRTFQG